MSAASYSKDTIESLQTLASRSVVYVLFVKLDGETDSEGVFRTLQGAMNHCEKHFAEHAFDEQKTLQWDYDNPLYRAAYMRRWSYYIGAYQVQD